jgi:regulator of protease activity HflC (stomatin/prohibitin superfamily)
MTIMSSCAYRGRASPTKWDVISRDNVSVKVSAVIYFRVVDAERAIIQVSNRLRT